MMQMKLKFSIPSLIGCTQHGLLHPESNDCLITEFVSEESLFPANPEFDIQLEVTYIYYNSI